jgi:cell division protein FtsX
MLHCTRLLKEQAMTIGAMKALGAKSGFITTHFILTLLVLGSLGTFAGGSSITIRAVIARQVGGVKNLGEPELMGRSHG